MADEKIEALIDLLDSQRTGGMSDWDDGWDAAMSKAVRLIDEIFQPDPPETT